MSEQTNAREMAERALTEAGYKVNSVMPFVWEHPATRVTVVLPATNEGGEDEGNVVEIQCTVNDLPTLLTGQARIAELEAENRRLRAALNEILALRDSDLDTFDCLDSAWEIAEEAISAVEGRIHQEPKEPTMGTAIALVKSAIGIVADLEPPNHATIRKLLWKAREEMGKALEVK